MPDRVTAQRPLTYYEILNVSPRASSEEIDRACYALWCRHEGLRTTVLWKDLNRHIEEIRDTLMNSEARARYDALSWTRGSNAHAIVATTSGAAASTRISAPGTATFGASSRRSTTTRGAPQAAHAESPHLAMSGSRLPPLQVFATHAPSTSRLSAALVTRYPAAATPAILFNQLVDWARPESWDDMTNIAELTVFLSVGLIGLAWSAVKLLQRRRRHALG